MTGKIKRLLLVVASLLLTGGLTIYFFSIGKEVLGTINLLCFLVNCTSLVILIYCYRRN